jgi:hypothetical protein
MGTREEALGLDRLRVVPGGRLSDRFLTGNGHASGDAGRDPLVERGFREQLGVRSLVCVPVPIGGNRRGVLSPVAGPSCVCATSDRFPEKDRAP